jgi:glycosyltransferase A (GT-A) superfamily protein (DUF2064 family)
MTCALVVAKAPVAGRAKTRLGTVIGDGPAAELAAAALLDTLAACEAAFGRRCHLALAGDLSGAARERELRAALSSWHVFEQVGESVGARLAHAHLPAAGESPTAVVQVGMDTPQVTPARLSAAAARLRPGGGVLGPAHDGGWWLLALDRPAAAGVLAGVPMSTSRTGFDTRRALTGWGVRVTTGPLLRDVDTVADAVAVAREAPDTRFAHAWSQLHVGVA